MTKKDSLSLTGHFFPTYLYLLRVLIIIIIMEHIFFISSHVIDLVETKQFISIIANNSYVTFRRCRLYTDTYRATCMYFSLKYEACIPLHTSQYEYFCFEMKRATCHVYDLLSFFDLFLIRPQRNHCHN